MKNLNKVRFLSSVAFLIIITFIVFTNLSASAEYGVSRLIQQGECQHQPGSGVQGRRWQQRRMFAQQLFDRKFNGWLHPERSGSRFWRGLRWGGAGFVLAWVAAHL